MVKPPPPAEDSNVSDTKAVPPSLDDTVHELCNLLFSITLPKTEKAKTAAITVGALRHARELVGSTCVLLQENHNGSQLDDISRQIEGIKTLLVTPHSSQSLLKPSYAATLTKSIMSPTPSPAPTAPQPLPARWHDITLTQKSHNDPAFSGLSNSELIIRITATLRDADVGLPAQPCALDAKGNEGAEWLTSYIRAVGHHFNGDIWIATTTEVGHNVLVERMDEWLPKLSDELHYSQKTYPVLVHGVPTSFNTSRDSEDIVKELIGKNSDIITHPAALQSTKFLGNTHGRMHQKAHGSLVIYFSDPTIVNACVNR